MNQEQEQNVEQMTPLDQMIAQDQLQMLKAAIPYGLLDILHPLLGQAQFPCDFEQMARAPADHSAFFPSGRPFHDVC